MILNPFAAPLRRLAAAAFIPMAIQALAFQAVMYLGWLYREPLGTYIPEGTGLLGPFYHDYGLFGPYIVIEFALVFFVLIGVVAGAIAVLVVEFRTRRLGTRAVEYLRAKGGPA